MMLTKMKIIKLTIKRFLILTVVFAIFFSIFIEGRKMSLKIRKFIYPINIIFEIFADNASHSLKVINREGNDLTSKVRIEKSRSNYNVSVPNDPKVKNMLFYLHIENPTGTPIQNFKFKAVIKTTKKRKNGSTIGEKSLSFKNSSSVGRTNPYIYLGFFIIKKQDTEFNSIGLFSDDVSYAVALSQRSRLN